MTYLLKSWFRVKDAYVGVIVAPTTETVTWLDVPVIWNGDFVTWTSPE